MNQIIETNVKKYKSNKNFFRIQFTISIFLIIIFVIILILKFNSNNNKEKISSDISENYNLYKLYSESLSKPATDDEILGKIEIPKINVKYPVFSKFDDELLKISPCRFYGKSPKEYGNLCVAGHNYNNSKFFSNLFLLENGDLINIYDNLEHKYIYKVFSSYEVKSSDMTPILNYDNNIKQLTLVTCNNLNQNRLIVKAKQ